MNPTITGNYNGNIMSSVKNIVTRFILMVTIFSFTRRFFLKIFNNNVTSVKSNQTFSNETV